MAAKPQRPPFAKQLVLVHHFGGMLAGRYEKLIEALAGTATGRQADGHSRFYHVLASLQDRQVSTVELKRYDRNILAHETTIGARRGDDFRLTYFQYAACLLTECYLDALTTRRAALLVELNATRLPFAPKLPAYADADLDRLAMFMSIGAGKTLVMHINLLQYLQYSDGANASSALPRPNAILVITPNAALSVQHRRELELSGLDHLPIEIREITKWFVPNADSRGPRKGESVSVEKYEGPNLILVDEGHKGTAGGADGEKAYRLIREALAARRNDDPALRLNTQRGFTFEYSATFAQIAAQDDELYQEYARCAIVEFAYGRFWRGGYGKDFRILNGRGTADAESVRDLVLTAGLLSFYQQVCWYQSHPTEVREYRLSAPLAVMLGTSVTLKEKNGTPDVVVVTRFLAHAASDAKWLAGKIRKVLDIRGVQQTLNGDPLDFSYLQTRALNDAALAADLQIRLFGGAGKLQVVRLNDNELGLRTEGATNDAFCGLIRVGDTKGLQSLLAEPGHALIAGGEDKLTGGLFADIDDRPNVKFLIGAKMFIEGWSSWRVSSMGLVNVGKSEGSQIVQMFGRGVRLLGRRGDLKRSGGNEKHPAYLELLETLNVFGLKADYMEVFLTALDREGAGRTLLEAPVTLMKDFDFARAGLLSLASSGDFRSRPVLFRAVDAPVKMVDLTETLSLVSGIGSVQEVAAESVSEQAIPVDANIIEETVLAMFALKRSNGWRNLALPPGEIATLLRGAQVKAPVGYFGTGFSGAARVRAAAQAAAENAVGGFYRREERRFLMECLETTPLLDSDGNMPWHDDGERTSKRLVYRLEIEVASDVANAVMAVLKQFHASGQVTQEFLQSVQAALSESVGLVDIADAIQKVLSSPAYGLPDDALGGPLPRIHMPQHLYAPLLLSQPVKVKADGQLDLDFEGRLGFRATPPLLEAGEIRFIWDLREFWKAACDKPEWQGVELFLLRNLPHRGVGLFNNVGFFPDFLLWLKRGKQQVLCLIEPKGLRAQWPDEKIDLLHTMSTKTLSIPLRGFMLTHTPLEAIQALKIIPESDRKKWLREKNILRQTDPDHIEYLLTTLKAAL